MSSTGSIDNKIYILDSVLTNATSFPFSTGNKDIRGLSISNNDSANKITVTLSFKDGGSDIAIPVAAGKNFESRVRSVSSVAKSGTVTDFEIALFERG